MVSPLEALQIELIELIVARLELCDIATLRLTSRIIETKASQGCFKAFFKQKNVDLTTTTLQDLVQATRQGRRGCLLRHCTITGIIRCETAAQDESAEDEDESTVHVDESMAHVDQSTEHVHLLTEAFCNLKQWSPEGGLASLCLCVAVRIEGADGEVIEPKKFRSWRKVWDAALHTFHVTITALHESQLPVNEHLDVFGSLRGCSLSYEAFLASAPKSASTHIFRSLKRLTASLSTPHEAVEGLPENDAEIQVQNWHRDHILQRILHILPTMPELASLDLHWYNICSRRSNKSVSPALSTTLEEGSISPVIPRLKECSLRGIYVSESDLLQFLGAVCPESVILTNTYLISGTYTSVFQYLTSPDSPVTCYHLDDLHEGKALRNTLVHFEVPGQCKFRYLRDVVGPSSLTRQEGHVKEAIHYRFAQGRPLGSGENMRWVHSKDQEFGPPRGPFVWLRYDFIAFNSQSITSEFDTDDDD